MDNSVKIPIVQVGEDKIFYLMHSDIMQHDKNGDCQIIHIEEPKAISLLRRSKTLLRLFRLIPKGSCYSRNKYIIFSMRKQIYIVDVQLRKLCGCFPVREHFSNPANIIPDNSPTDYVAYYGDYGNNQELESVNIYGITDKFEKKVLYTFPPGEIRHVHNIISGSGNDGYYVFTGDHGEGAGIYWFDGKFQHKTRLVSGNQTFRAVQGYVLNQRLYYATDAVMEDNYVFSLESEKPAPQAKEVAELCGPCIYGSRIADGYIFASCVESDENVKGRFRKFFTRKLGKGVKDRYARLYFINSKEEIREIAKFPKDMLPIKLFQYGTVVFPYVTGEVNKLYCLPIGIKGKDLRLSVIEKEKANGYVFRVCGKGVWG